jgi:hypothetical protein
MLQHRPSLVLRVLGDTCHPKWQHLVEAHGYA